MPCSGTFSYLRANIILKLAADKMAIPEQHDKHRLPFAFPKRSGYVLVKRARPSFVTVILLLLLPVT